MMNPGMLHDFHQPRSNCETNATTNILRHYPDPLTTPALAAGFSRSPGQGTEGSNRTRSDGFHHARIKGPSPSGGKHGFSLIFTGFLFCLVGALSRESIMIRFMYF